MIWVVLLLVILAGAMYAVGYSDGKSRGYDEGQLDAALSLAEEAKHVGEIIRRQGDVAREALR